MSALLFQFMPTE